MKKFVILFFILFSAILFAKKMEITYSKMVNLPKIVVFDNGKNKIIFNHEKHFKTFQCQSCHHSLKDNSSYQYTSCYFCHQKKNSKKQCIKIVNLVIKNKIKI